MKVSICIPTYNQTDFLKKCLDSILYQTYNDYEVVITDDSTTNDVQDLIQSMNVHFGGKLKYQRNATRLGTSGNWNESIRLASSEVIKIMHHDDWFTSKDSLFKFVSLIQDRSVNFAFSSSVLQNISTGASSIHSISEEQLSAFEENPTVLFLGNFIGDPSSTIFRKKEGFFFDLNLKWNVDFDFYMRYVLAFGGWSYCSDPLVNVVAYADHSVTNECLADSQLLIYEDFYLFNRFRESFQSQDASAQHLVSLLKRLKCKSNS